MSTHSEDSLDARLRQRRATKNALETEPAANAPRGNIPNTPLASSTIAFLLGATFAFGLYTVFLDISYSARIFTYQLGFFIAAWAFFHWAEFAVTAGWNFEKCSVDCAFSTPILNPKSLSFGQWRDVPHRQWNCSIRIRRISILHTRKQIMALCITDRFGRLFIWQDSKSLVSSPLGMIMVICGQILRSAAMIHASTNFSHSVAFQKRDTHRLVTDGVYGWFRHPSYAGFYYWAIGTQLVLQNPLTLVMFAILLWRFFYYRTRAEENALVKFFGEEYVNYRRRVGTKIPFVP
ncbi:hypothetical protein CVT26_007378 [Gymnopilus dilepis]|uniref:Protein-S-isoprenylcysteine O-methyltransferase n=1 Tax=Gymnopilus dilepis TaxID=231916 RepID=A0A409VP04_9AGAR|nr:hypothetical protein CVT26_007378 [Gymnopilus dilepis]